MSTQLKTTVNNSLTKQNQKPTFSSFMTSSAVKSKISSMIGGKDSGGFITSIVSAVSINNTLAECDYMSIFSAAMVGAALKLHPSPQLGQYYFVPFNDKKKGCKVAQFQIGYKGYIQLAKRSGIYKKINVVSIKEGELIKYDPLEEELQVNLIQDDTEREQTPTMGYYAMFEELNGFKKTMYWSIEKMQAHADKYSQAFRLENYKKLKAGKINSDELWKYSSFWYKDFDGMAHKTMLRQLISKWGTMSIELQNAIDKDMAVIDERGNATYVDSPDFDIQEPEKVIEAKSPESSQGQPEDNEDLFQQ